METISDCLHLKVNLKENIYLYVSSTTHRCSNRKIKTFLSEDFFHLPLLSTHLWCSLSCKYLCEFLETFETLLIGYTAAWRNLFMKKNVKWKISWHCPLIHFLLCTANSFTVFESVSFLFVALWWEALPTSTFSGFISLKIVYCIVLSVYSSNMHLQNSTYWAEIIKWMLLSQSILPSVSAVIL